MTAQTPACARCGFKNIDRLCMGEKGRSPADCPTVHHQEAVEKALEEMKKPEIMAFARQASIQEAEGYTGRHSAEEPIKPIKPRIKETIEFAQRMDYRRLGMAFCIGLRREARVVESLLTESGFTVVSALCKAGGSPKEVIGVRDDQKIDIGSFEAMCNPIAQAYILNAEETDFNIVIGLCVGHDSLFLKYSQAPCTVLVAKDRLLGHNPLAAIYNIDSYYRSLRD